MNTEIITSCPICEHEQFELFLKSKDHTTTREEFELKRCKNCQFIVTSPRPSEAAIGKYYASDNYISHSGKSSTIFDKIYLAARSITLKWKSELIKEYTPKPGTILDFGCGTGDFLYHLKTLGYQVVGIEPSLIAREKANQKTIGKVSEDLSLIKNNSADMITLWHVLEHVHSLNETLQDLKKKLSQNGHLIIAVPNPASHDCKKYKENWAGYDVPRHLWHFTRQSMRSLLHRNGFEIVAIKPMILDSYYVSLLSEQYKNPKQLKLITAIKAFSEGMTSNLLARKNKEYSSLIYIARPE